MELCAAGVAEQVPEVGLRHAAARHHADRVAVNVQPLQPIQLGDQLPTERESSLVIHGLKLPQASSNLKELHGRLPPIKASLVCCAIATSRIREIPVTLQPNDQFAISSIMTTFLWQ